MCTAATYQTEHFYFGRTLDYEFSYGDSVTITPRNYPFHFRHAPLNASHYAIIGMAHIASDYPLYYDACNEQGLCMAGLNFVGNAVYRDDLSEAKDNICQFELIPWILCQCAIFPKQNGFFPDFSFFPSRSAPPFPLPDSTGSLPIKQALLPWNPRKTVCLFMKTRLECSPTIRPLKHRCFY